MKPPGCDMYTHSFSNPYINALLTLARTKSQIYFAPLEYTTRKVEIWTTGAKISQKLIPYFCLNPLSTNLAKMEYNLSKVHTFAIKHPTGGNWCYTFMKQKKFKYSTSF